MEEDKQNPIANPEDDDVDMSPIQVDDGDGEDRQRTSPDSATPISQLPVPLTIAADNEHEENAIKTEQLDTTKQTAAASTSEQSVSDIQIHLKIVLIQRSRVTTMKNFLNLQ